jgi:hypothetical protein
MATCSRRAGDYEAIIGPARPSFTLACKVQELYVRCQGGKAGTDLITHLLPRTGTGPGVIECVRGKLICGRKSPMGDVSVRAAIMDDYTGIYWLFTQLARHHVEILSEVFQSFPNPPRNSGTRG